MLILGSLLASLFLARSATALPLELKPLQLHRRDVSAATQALIAAAPSTASCDGAQYPKECATAAQAAPAIINGFVQYNITTCGEQAALLSIMLFESGDFKFNVNHFPGVPGQGTRNMQSPAFNAKYAAYLHSTGKIKDSDYEAAKDPVAVLNLLEPDEFSFASAAWFLDTQCSADTRTQLSAGTQEGYESYLTNCVGTTATQDRITGWQAAMKVVQ